MPTFTDTRTVTFFVQTCCNCGVQFGMTDDYDNRRRADQRTFYCPSGHPQSYTKSEADKLRAQLEQEQRRVIQARNEADREAAARLAAERSNSALRGVVTRQKNRAAKGQCPCCPRQFTNLQAHMAAQHPGWEKTAPEAEPAGSED